MRVDGIGPAAQIQSTRPVAGSPDGKYPEVKLPGKHSMRENPAELKIAPEKEVIALIEQANRKFEFCNTRAEFSIHEKTREIMIKVYRNEELIREIPPEKILDLVAKMLELAGLLVDEKA